MDTAITDRTRAMAAMAALAERGALRGKPLPPRYWIALAACRRAGVRVDGVKL